MGWVGAARVVARHHSGGQDEEEAAMNLGQAVEGTVQPILNRQQSDGRGYVGVSNDCTDREIGDQLSNNGSNAGELQRQVTNNSVSTKQNAGLLRPAVRLLADDLSNW